MTKGNSSQDLENVSPGCGFAQTAICLLQFVQDGVVYVLENKIQATLAPEKLDQVNEVFMT